MEESSASELQEKINQLNARAGERDREFQRLKAQAKEREQELEQQLGEANERAEKSQRDLRDTTLTEYLENCHRHLSESISVQTNSSLTTKGDASNATGKFRPDFLQPWKDFLDTQKVMLEQLFSSYQSYNNDRAFESTHFVKTLGKRTADRKLASELDLHSVIRETVETPLTAIVNYLRTKDGVQDLFQLPENFWFDNHLNTLSDRGQEVETEAQQLQPSTPPQAKPFKSLLKPDQVCVYTTVDNLRMPVLIAEFKPPHKLTLDVLRRVLDPDGPEIELQTLINQVVIPLPSETKAHFDYKAHEVVAAVLSQAFSYMVTSEVKYGYITTGEAFVFLRIQWEEERVKRVHYHLAEPSRDVIAQKEQFPETELYLHRTAISQLLAFSLLALQSAEEKGGWRDEAVAELETWRTDTDAMLKQFPETPSTAGKSSVTEYKSRAYTLDSPTASPISRHLRTSKESCGPGPTSQANDDREPSSDEEPSRPEIPTRPHAAVRGKRSQQARSSARGGPSSHGGHKRSFCTQMCLQGLARGGPLDLQCPNVSDHCGEGFQGNRHQLDCEAFRTLLSEQLQRSRRDACRPLGLQGARGALFEVTLPSHGYTVVAKGTVLAFVQDLRHEAEVYQRLTSIQGVHVPIFLGNIDLKKPFYYDAGIRIVHMMLLSWSGQCLVDGRTLEGMDKKAGKLDLMGAINAIHEAGVVHQDIRLANLLWNEELKRVMVIDFERAKIVKGIRRALSPWSPNRERKRLCVAKVEGEDKMVKMMREDFTIRVEVATDINAAQGMFT